jgi:hypothetical protein
MTWIIGLILTTVAVVAFFIFAWWSVPIIIIAAVLFVLALLFSRKGAATVERTARAQPTGTPVKSTSGTETANERVGQT